MPEKIRFYLDEMVDNAVAAGLRRRGIDVLTTHEAHQGGKTDIEQLDFAHAEGRVLFTKDNDYLVLNAEGREHAGIVYIHQHHYSIGRAVHGLTQLHETRTAEDMHGQVVYL